MVEESYERVTALGRLKTTAVEQQGWVAGKQCWVKVEMKADMVPLWGREAGICPTWTSPNGICMSRDKNCFVSFSATYNLVLCNVCSYWCRFMHTRVYTNALMCGYVTDTASTRLFVFIFKVSNVSIFWTRSSDLRSSSQISVCHFAPSKWLTWSSTSSMPN